MKQLDIYADNNECEDIFGVNQKAFYVTTVNNPVLLTDLSKISKLDPGLRDAIFSLYMSDERTVVYHDVESHHSVHLYPQVWSANIDTVRFAKNLKSVMDSIEGTVLECGTGSGFLSQFMLHHNKEIKKLYATDINPYALQSLNDNCKDARLETVLTDEDHLGVDEKPDVLVCNPPYIPRPNAKTNNPYEGFKLIELILASKPKRLLINVSSTAGDLGLDNLIDEFWVPLKVNAVTNSISKSSRTWLDWLVKNGRVDIRDAECGYEYWHLLRFYDINNS